MAAKRQGLSKKLRFEVFKRDDFRCQYCGATAPDVLLVIDHVKPVAEGGGNDILNLLTACEPCNAGKGPRELSDQSALAKQRDQMEALNERREQLEMMIEWKEELSRLGEQVVDRIADHWSSLARGFSLNEHGRQELRKLLRKYPADEVMEAMGIAADQYLEFDEGVPTHASVNKAWSKIGGICSVRQGERDKPYLRKLIYTRGILRNRLSYLNEREVMELMEDAHLGGASLDAIEYAAKKCSSWTNFVNRLADAVDPP